jgi:hypothetical protein
VTESCRTGAWPVSIVLGVNSTRLELTRACCRAYPFRRGRWRLASLLFTGSPGTWEEVPRIALQEMRGHQLVRCRYGLNVRVREDLTYVDPFVFGDYEPTLTRALRRLVRPGATVFDIGANFGWYTCLLARAVGSEGHVHAFEPVPSITALARETIELNQAEHLRRSAPLACVTRRPRSGGCIAERLRFDDDRRLCVRR